MVKPFLLLLVSLILLPCSLFAHSEEEEKKSPRLLKTPLSFLPSNDQEQARKVEKERQAAKKERAKKDQEREKFAQYKKRVKNKRYKYLINSWEPYWVAAKEIEEEKYLFFQTNIGVGFLYFDKVRGNIGALPASEFRINGSIPLQGRLRYNRTPLFEFLLGYQELSWVSAAISYQHQSSVTVFTKFIDSQNAFVDPGEIVRDPQGQFRSDFSIDAFMLKGYVEFPWPMIWKMTAYTPYLGAGIGMGWQSWTRVEDDLTSNFTSNFQDGAFRVYLSNQLFFRAKYCANFVWGADAGIKIQNALPSNHFSIKAGCKYNQWGQARNLGKGADQDGATYRLIKPFSIKTVYSFAPYLGFQWNIPNSSFSLPPDMVGGRAADTWKPYFVDGSELQLPRAIFSQFTAGIGFLYFAGVKGALTIGPLGGYSTNYGECPGKFSLGYNRTPVIEYIFGFRISPWFKAGFSKQFQSNIYIQTKDKRNINGVIPAFSQFQANLNLLSGGLKIYLEIPKPLIWKNLAYAYFLSGTAGPCWQSWNRMGVVIKAQNGTSALSSLFPLRSKVVPNPYFMADTGLKIKNARFDVNFYMIAGCKYSYWGAARNLGKIDQQYPSYRVGLVEPFQIKTLYSFVPYLGVQWDFGSAYQYTHKKPYLIDGKDVSAHLPFVAKIKGLYKERPFFTQVNTGVGFLYFDQVRSNLAGVPAAGNFSDLGSYEYSGKPSYNRTPLFEFLIGRRIFDWWSIVLSYQSQGSVAISTPLLKPTTPPPSTTVYSDSRASFVANFRVDAIMPKLYFHSPWSLVWMRVVSNPYIAVGAGIGWQSWTRIDVQRPTIITSADLPEQLNQSLNQKISANAVWTIDCGFKSCVAYPGARLSTTLGIKFNDWGQARSMGSIDSLNGSRTGIFKPFKVLMVYSFAPYFGVQFNF